MPFSIKTFMVLLTAITAVFAVPHPEPQLGGVVGGLLGEVGPLLNLVPVLASPPPAFLWTKNPSPECANINQGALYCCDSTFNGDMPLVVELSDLLQYKLNPNSINCIFGMSSISSIVILRY
jgi:hypothetical protein